MEGGFDEDNSTSKKIPKKGVAKLLGNAFLKTNLAVRS
jgi:hypothetical protein